MPADLRTRVGHLDLPSPILTASGCAGAGRELAHFTDVARVGAVITKSVTLEPRAGNPAPRMAETPSGLLSSVGLQGPGLDGFLQRDLPWLLSRGARAFVSVAGHTAREYGEIASRLSDSAGLCDSPWPDSKAMGHAPAEAALGKEALNQLVFENAASLSAHRKLRKPTASGSGQLPPSNPSISIRPRKFAAVRAAYRGVETRDSRSSAHG